jgi:hypothetical protein
MHRYDEDQTLSAALARGEPHTAEVNGLGQLLAR